MAATASTGSVLVPATSIRPVALSIRASLLRASGSSSTRNARIGIHPWHCHKHSIPAAGGGSRQFCFLTEQLHQAGLQIIESVSARNAVQGEALAGISDLNLQGPVS